MRDLIRKILKESVDYEIVKRAVTKQLEKKVKSGEVPSLNFDYLQKIGLGNFEDEIRQIYLDFVGGKEEAFKLFKKYIEGRTISDDDLRKSGVAVMQEDIYKVKIYKIFNENFGPYDELEFSFDIVSGQFETSEGILTLKELHKEEYDDIWVDVTDHLRSEIEFYILVIGESDFGLYFDVATSHWS